MFANQLQLYYSSSEVGSDGGDLPQKTVTSDSTDRQSINWVDASGIEWEYAVGYFDANTATVGLRGVMFSVLSATGTQIILATQLPTYPSTGDTFRLIQGSRFRSSSKIPINSVNALIPEWSGVSLSSLSGVTIKQCVSDVDLYLFYDADFSVIVISTDNETWHSALDVSSDVTDGYIQADTGEWVSVDVDASSLPSDSTTETILVSKIFSTMIPTVWVGSDNENSVLHHFAILKNDSIDSGDIESITAQSIEIVSTTIASTYTDGDGYIDLTDGSDFPGRDFWLCLNESEIDLRYVTKRAGNRCYLANTSDWQIVEFSGGRLEPTIGEQITSSESDSGGILRAVYLVSGTWAGLNAAGYFIVSDCEGVIGTVGLFQGVLIGDLVDSYYGIRGTARASSWIAGSSVQNYPSFDLALISPDSNNEFDTIENTQSLMPVLFSPWTSGAVYYEKIIDASFGPDDIVCLSLRRFLLNGIQGNLQIEQDLRFSWE